MKAKAVLHVISDRNRHRLPLFESLVDAAQGGADVIQIREKKAPSAETYALVEQLQQVFAQQNLSSSIFVNDRTDIAITAGVGGVHLASKSLPIQAVRRLRALSGWRGLIGCSVHALDEAERAERAGADYVTFGHIFASESHPDLAPRGLLALQRVVERLSIPVVAIGGIDASNMGAVLETGCSGIAVIGAVLDTKSPREAAMELKEAMEKTSFSPKTPFSSITSSIPPVSSMTQKEDAP